MRTPAMLLAASVICSASFVSIAATTAQAAATAPRPTTTDDNSLAGATSMAGQQRLLSHRMVKDFLQVAADINPAASREALRAGMESFEAGMSSLRQSISGLQLDSQASGRLNDELSEMGSIFEELKPGMQSVASGGSAEGHLVHVASVANAFSDACDRAASILSRQGQGSGESSRMMAMSAQAAAEKMSKELLLVHLDINADANRKRLQQSMSQLEKSLASLSGSQPKAQEQLGAAMQQMKAAKAAMPASSDDKQPVSKDAAAKVAMSSGLMCKSIASAMEQMSPSAGSAITKADE